MEEGSLRFDVNVSVRPKGDKTLRNKIEIKNLNSFNYLELAIESEVKRQIWEYSHHPEKPFDQVITQATYRWDTERKETILMRRKEQAEDYRYFPEPDLPPILLDKVYIEEIRRALPELPLQREKRYVKELGLPPHTAFSLTYDKPLADYFEEALKYTSNAKSLGNWLIVEFAGRFKESGSSIVTSGISPRHVGQLIDMIDRQIINGKIAKSVADEMLSHPDKDPQAIIDANPNYKPLNDLETIEKIVDQVLAENPQSVADFKAGRERGQTKAFAFLVGQVMKLTQGRASPQAVNDVLNSKINT